MHPSCVLALALLACASPEIDLCIDTYEAAAALCGTDSARASLVCESEATAAEELGCIGQFNSRQRCRNEVTENAPECGPLNAQLNADCSSQDLNFADCMGRDVTLDGDLSPE